MPPDLPHRFSPGEWEQVPLAPGVYCFHDQGGRVLYVGKAVRLRERVRSYFRPGQRLPRAKRDLVRMTRTIGIRETGSELEALLLEAEWIRVLRPPYNVFLRRQRLPLFLRLDLSQPFPPLELTRDVRRDGALLFGPLRSQEFGETLVRMLQRLLQLRSCGGHLVPHQTHRPCVDLEMRRCQGPCIGALDAREYQRRVQQAAGWLSGDDPPLLQVLREKRQEAIAGLRFEEAARWHAGLEVLGDQGRPLRLSLPEQTGVLLSPAGRAGEWKVLVVRDACLLDAFEPSGRWRAKLRRWWALLGERPTDGGKPLELVELYRICLLHHWLRRAPERYPFFPHSTATPAEQAVEWVVERLRS